MAYPSKYKITAGPNLVCYSVLVFCTSSSVDRDVLTWVKINVCGIVSGSNVSIDESSLPSRTVGARS